MARQQPARGEHHRDHRPGELLAQGQGPAHGQQRDQVHAGLPPPKGTCDRDGQRQEPGHDGQGEDAVSQLVRAGQPRPETAGQPGQRHREQRGGPPARRDPGPHGPSLAAARRRCCDAGWQRSSTTGEWAIRHQKAVSSVQAQNLTHVARAIVAPGKGILAADESSGTIEKSFRSIQVESTEEHRRAYRELLFTPDDANAEALARFAALSQEAGLVPIVEPEVLMDGAHTIERCYDVTADTLGSVFAALRAHRVRLDGTLLKPTMVLSGNDCPEQAGAQQVAEATVRCLRDTVPASVPGIVFLSGGQTDEAATAHLNAMNQLGAQPWQLSFSYGRALQAPALKAWKGEPANGPSAQRAFYHRARLNGAARFGRYSEEMETLGA